MITVNSSESRDETCIYFVSVVNK